MQSPASSPAAQAGLAAEARRPLPSPRQTEAAGATQDVLLLVLEHAYRRELTPAAETYEPGARDEQARMYSALRDLGSLVEDARVLALVATMSRAHRETASRVPAPLGSAARRATWAAQHAAMCSCVAALLDFGVVFTDAEWFELGRLCALDALPPLPPARSAAAGSLDGISACQARARQSWLRDGRARAAAGGRGRRLARVGAECPNRRGVGSHRI